MMNLLRQFFRTLTAPLRVLLTSPRALISAPRRLLGISLPARVAVLVAIFLVVCTITFCVTFLLAYKRADFWLWFTSVRIGVILVLLVVIPLVVYQALNLWLEGDVSRYPDIDYAWAEGMAALEQSGLDLSAVPIFLIVGAPDEHHNGALMDASQLSLRVSEVPQGPAALHWYANPEAIYLVCTQTCRSGKLAKIAASGDPRGSRPISAPSGSGRQQDMLRGTIVAGGPDELHDSGPIPSPDEEPSTAQPDWGGSPDIRGTMIAGASDAGTGGAASAASTASLSPREATDQSDRLEYVCQLLRRARQPVCPINGILTLMPFGVMQRGPAEGIEVQRAVKEDLATIRRVLKMRCPVTALVVGMEEESGFRELVRRVGPERAKAQRFGKGFNVWNPPTGEQIEAVSARACGAFEDWAYTLFREKGGLSKPGNTKLYALLCKIRSNLRNRLTNVLVASYAHEAGQSASDREPLLFSGCYFAATGQSEDRQAFVKNVFDKLLDEEEELQWTEEALVEDDRYQRLGSIGFAINVLLIIALAGMLAVKYFDLL